GMNEWTRFNQAESPFSVGTTAETTTSFNKDFLGASRYDPCPGAKQSHLVDTWDTPVLTSRILNAAGKPYIRGQALLRQTRGELFDLDGTKLGEQIDSFDYDGVGNTTKVSSRRVKPDGSRDGSD